LSHAVRSVMSVSQLLKLMLGWLQVLHDAVLFGVFPIIYEYEATTLEFLLHRLDTCLHGRTARWPAPRLVSI